MSDRMNFSDALNGRRGDFDAWLEVNNEAECRAAVIAHVAAAVAAERERCAKVCEAINAGLYTCDINGSPSDEYVAKWRVLQAIRAG